jgi:hypothetical protein
MIPLLCESSFLWDASSEGALPQLNFSLANGLFAKHTGLGFQTLDFRSHSYSGLCDAEGPCSENPCPGTFLSAVKKEVRSYQDEGILDCMWL